MRMLDKTELKKIAQARVKDAEILFKSRRYDGATYLCGYAIETALKYRICQVLKWHGYPSTNKEFQSVKSFKTHNFDDLLHLSGREEKIKKNYLADWSVVSTWEPEMRYKPIGSAKKKDVKLILDSSKTLLKVL